MPLKIRGLIRDLESAGFVIRGGKGNHRNFRHPKRVNITLSSAPRQEAKRYQIRDVKRAVELTGDEEE